MARYPSSQTTIKAAICAHDQQRKQGAGIHLSSAVDDQPHLGPVGHLLTQLHKVDATLDMEFNVQQHQEEAINLLPTPWQCLRPQIEAIAKRHRFQKAALHQQYLQGAPALDHHVLKEALRKKT